MAFATTDLPQADKLDKVIQTVEAINQGVNTDLGIANQIGFTDRQGRYYRHAAESLGFITNHNNLATITDLGKDLIEAVDYKKKLILQQAILNNTLFKAILEEIKKFPEGLIKKEIEEFVYSITINPSQSTIKRRLTTLIQWLIDPNIELLVKKGNRYIYNPIIILDDEDTKEEDFYDREDSDEASVYPINDYNFELDIREDHLTVFGLVRKTKQNKVKLNPDFQRNLVWKPGQKSKFIESLILNIPLPPIYVSQDLEGNYIIVDGLQRTTTLIDYLEGKFALEGLQAIPRLNGSYFSDLDSELKARIEDKNLLLYVLKSSVPMVVVYDIFNRINTGGTQLTRQEIRNCIFIGNSTELLKLLASSDNFKRATGNGISPNRMKDREAVLRYLAFKLFDYNILYKNDMDEFLGDAMKKINLLNQSNIDNSVSDFHRTMKLTFDFFGERNFRLPTEFSRGRINIAIMESVGYFFSNTSESFLNENKERIISNYYNSLIKNTDYLDSIRSSTGTTSKVKTRFRKASEILGNIKL